MTRYQQIMNDIVETRVNVVNVEWDHDGSFMKYSFEIQIYINNTQRWQTTINKRFSEFIQLEKDMLNELNQKRCAYELPLKTYSFWRGGKVSDVNDEKIRDRKLKLMKYLYDILNNSFDIKWRDSKAVKTFLGFDASNWSQLINNCKKIGSQSNKYNHDKTGTDGDEWLKLFRDCKNDLTQCQRDYNMNGLMKLRLKTNNLQNKLTFLQSDNGNKLSMDEIDRRQNLLRLLKNDINELSLESAASSFDSNVRIEPEERNPGFIERTTTLNTIKKPIINSRRKFGETTQTEGLNNQQLYTYNKTVLQNQDSDLKQLQAIIQRQKALSLDMNDELRQQNEILDEFDQDVTRIKGKMDKTDDKAQRFDK